MYATQVCVPVHLLVHMRPIAIDGVKWSVTICVCMGHIDESCKTAEQIEMLFGRLIHVGSKNHVGLLEGACHTGRDTFRGTYGRSVV